MTNAKCQIYGPSAFTLLILKYIGMPENVIQKKSYEFALKTVRLCKWVEEQKREYILSRQLIRSATSVGANVEEAIGGQTNKDFFCKMTIAYKEARESRYWLRLLYEANYIDQKIFNELDLLGDEVCKILSKIQLTMKNKGKIYA